MQCAVDGDEVCLKIIERSAKHLSELPLTLAKQYNGKTVPVALMGGIIDADTLLAKLLREELAKYEQLKIVEPKGTALDGAISLGKKLIDEMI
jgi:N-acetylglucosamine kinase-like BadF-type ATPase